MRTDRFAAFAFCVAMVMGSCAFVVAACSSTTEEPGVEATPVYKITDMSAAGGSGVRSSMNPVTSSAGEDPIAALIHTE